MIINYNDVVEKIASYCINNNIKFIYISGNGGSGKTTLSKMIKNEIEKYGVCNTIEMDDFVVDTTLRNNAVVTWIDPKTGDEHSGKYTTSFEASYFMQNIKAIICNLRRGNNYWHWPKKGKTCDDSVVEFKANAKLTIVEGISSVFLNKDNDVLSIFLTCSKEVEIERRILRARSENEKNRDLVEKSYIVRNSQFEANILPHKNKADISMISLEDFSFKIEKDVNKIF